MLTHVNDLLAEQTLQAKRIADNKVNTDQLRDAVVRKTEKFADKVNRLIAKTDDLKQAHADMVVTQNGFKQVQNIQGRQIHNMNKYVYKHSLNTMHATGKHNRRHLRIIWQLLHTMNDMLALDQDEVKRLTINRLRAAGFCANGDRSIFERSCSDPDNLRELKKSFAGAFSSKAEEMKFMKNIIQIVDFMNAEVHGHEDGTLGSDAFRMKGLHFYDNDGEAVGIFDENTNIIKIIDGRDKSADHRPKAPIKGPTIKADIEYIMRNSRARKFKIDASTIDEIRELTDKEREECERIVMNLDSDEEAKDNKDQVVVPGAVNIDELCAICVDSIVWGDEVYKLVCGHLYHAHCLETQILSMKDKRIFCPLCKDCFGIPLHPEAPAYDILHEMYQNEEIIMHEMAGDGQDDTNESVMSSDHEHHF